MLENEEEKFQDLDQARSEISKNEFEKDMENYDLKNYRGIDEYKNNLHYNTQNLGILGVDKQVDVSPV